MGMGFELLEDFAFEISQSEKRFEEKEQIAIDQEYILEIRKQLISNNKLYRLLEAMKDTEISIDIRTDLDYYSKLLNRYDLSSKEVKSMISDMILNKNFIEALNQKGIKLCITLNQL